jgi:hypothetical protein
MEVAVFYFILSAPPGYPETARFMVGAYDSMDPCSYRFGLRKPDGEQFASTLGEARAMLPAEAIRRPFLPVDQFLELWEA